MPYLIQDSLITIISRFMRILFPIWSRTGSPWFLDGFYTEYYLLKEGITCLPEKACYVENPSDLVFDTKLPVIPQYEHIFGDEENAARLPKEVRDSSMKNAAV